MIVRVEAAVFGPAAGHTFELLDIVHLCALQRHALVFEPGARGAAERWCTSLGDVVGRLLSDELDLARRHGAKAAQRGRMRTELRLDGGAQDHWDSAPPVLSVRTAWAYLHLPLRVIVENVRSDGAFVAAMLHGDDGEFLRAAMADGRLAFAHGGGLGDVRRFVEALVDDPGARMRAVVLFDHDGFIPAKRSGPSSALKAFCEEHAIDHHARVCLSS